MVQPSRHRSNRRTHRLTLPELEHSKVAVLNSLGSLQSRRSYKHAIDEFICWYCSRAEVWLSIEPWFSLSTASRQISLAASLTRSWPNVMQTSSIPTSTRVPATMSAVADAVRWADEIILCRPANAYTQCALRNCVNADIWTEFDLEL